MAFTRRRFLQSGTLTLASAGSLAQVILAASPVAARHRRPFAGYGELVADPNQLLDLPRGFSYRVFSVEGDAMGSVVVPGSHDGMAAFDARNAGDLAR
jgi:secreted PhoX family phosphatase